MEIYSCERTRNTLEGDTLNRKGEPTIMRKVSQTTNILKMELSNVHGKIMKLSRKEKLILFVLITSMGFVGARLMIDEEKSKIATDNLATDSNASITFTNDYQFQHTLAFTAEGELLLDRQPLERFSDPEIKEILKSIAQSLEKNSMMNIYGRQTDYLLMELEKCQSELKELKEGCK